MIWAMIGSRPDGGRWPSHHRTTAQAEIFESKWGPVAVPVLGHAGGGRWAVPAPGHAAETGSVSTRVACTARGVEGAWPSRKV